MRIIHLSRSDFRGAPSRGVLTLHRQLLARGISSRFFAKECFLKETEQIPSFESVLLSELTQKVCFDENLAHELASSFTLGCPGCGQLDIQTLSDADLIHLHDIKGLFSPQAVNRLIGLGKPVVWSLPDMWAFTGGCHQALTCEGYRTDCKNCPQLKVDRHGLPALLLEKKRALFAAPNLHLVAPSQWLAERAAESRVFGPASIHTIPPAASDALCPLPKREAKAQLGLNPEAFTLLVVCENTGSQQRHREAVKQLLENCALFHVFTRLAHKKQLHILILGTATEEFKLDYGVIHAGDADAPEKLSRLLSAADIAVLPHVEENGSAIVLEAASCGTPVIAMSAGGVDESIRDGVTGKLVLVGDLRRMAEEISYAALHRRIQEEWERNCFAASAEAPKDSVERHLLLYRQCLETHPAPAMEHAEVGQLELRSELSDLVPMLLDNIDALLRAPQAQEKSAPSAADDLRRPVMIAIDKLSLAEQRIQKELRKGPRNPTIEKSVISIGKLRKYLARELSEKAPCGEMQTRFLPPCAPADFTGTRKASKMRDRILQWVCDAYLVKSHTARPGVLAQHAPRPMSLEKFPKPRIAARKLPTIAIVTPSYMQGGFIEETIRSVLDQGYPKLRYAVQDAASTDETVEILKKYSSRITSWVSEPDTGQARAIACGFEKVSGDIMAWLNSDDLLMPGALRFVGEYFRNHPDVDAIYGHRVTINENSQEIGRWVLPPHDPEVLLSLDPVPQETLFWRESLWRKVGGISPNFRFAMDWDLLLRFQKSGAKIVRVPYYLGCFRVHSLQKTSSQMETIGNQEVTFLRLTTPGSRTDPVERNLLSQRVTRQSALCARLLRFGIRW